MECYDIIISIASNDQQEQNLSEARRCLGQILSDLHYTDELWTEPYHAKNSSRLYLNQLAYATTTFNAQELNAELKKIEKQMGRTPEQKQQGIVTIDLDLMQHNGQRYHLTDWERPYIQQLLVCQAKTEDL